MASARRSSAGWQAHSGHGLSTLYVVATPIGNLEDVTARALRILAEIPVVAAEDTRVTSRLLARHGIRVRMISYRAPVERRSLPRLLEALEAGDVALVSDAGMPTISDPGRQLVDAAWEAGHAVVAIPGASAVTAAVAAAGFPGEGFLFAGYLPRKPGEMGRFLAKLADEPRPVVVFDSPHRIKRSLEAIRDAFPQRRLLLARELTKLHEQLVRGVAEQLLAALPEPVRGEVTLVLAPPEGE